MFELLFRSAENILDCMYRKSDACWEDPNSFQAMANAMKFSHVSTNNYMYKYLGMRKKVKVDFLKIVKLSNRFLCFFLEQFLAEIRCTVYIKFQLSFSKNV